jgi:hypothetical protein
MLATQRRSVFQYHVPSETVAKGVPAGHREVRHASESTVYGVWLQGQQFSLTHQLTLAKS